VLFVSARGRISLGPILRGESSFPFGCGFAALGPLW
jgi:hypothetical protein